MDTTISDRLQGFIGSCDESIHRNVLDALKTLMNDRASPDDIKSINQDLTALQDHPQGWFVALNLLFDNNLQEDYKVFASQLLFTKVQRSFHNLIRHNEIELFDFSKLIFECIIRMIDMSESLHLNTERVLYRICEGASHISYELAEKEWLITLDISTHLLNGTPLKQWSMITIWKVFLGKYRHDGADILKIIELSVRSCPWPILISILNRPESEALPLVNWEIVGLAKELLEIFEQRLTITDSIKLFENESTHLMNFITKILNLLGNTSYLLYDGAVDFYCQLLILLKPWYLNCVVKPYYSSLQNNLNTADETEMIQCLNNHVNRDDLRFSELNYDTLLTITQKLWMLPADDKDNRAAADSAAGDAADIYGSRVMRTLGILSIVTPLCHLSKIMSLTDQVQNLSRASAAEQLDNPFKQLLWNCDVNSITIEKLLQQNSGGEISTSGSTTTTTTTTAGQDCDLLRCECVNYALKSSGWNSYLETLIAQPLMLVFLLNPKIGRTNNDDVENSSQLLKSIIENLLLKSSIISTDFALDTLPRIFDLICSGIRQIDISENKCLAIGLHQWLYGQTSCQLLHSIAIGLSKMDVVEEDFDPYDHDVVSQELLGESVVSGIRKFLALYEELEAVMPSSSIGNNVIILPGHALVIFEKCLTLMRSSDPIELKYSTGYLELSLIYCLIMAIDSFNMEGNEELNLIGTNTKVHSVQNNSQHNQCAMTYQFLGAVFEYLSEYTPEVQKNYAVRLIQSFICRCDWGDRSTVRRMDYDYDTKSQIWSKLLIFILNNLIQLNLVETKLLNLGIPEIHRGLLSRCIPFISDEAIDLTRQKLTFLMERLGNTETNYVNLKLVVSLLQLLCSSLTIRERFNEIEVIMKDLLTRVKTAALAIMENEGSEHMKALVLAGTMFICAGSATCIVTKSSSSEASVWRNSVYEELRLLLTEHVINKSIAIPSNDAKNVHVMMPYWLYTDKSCTDELIARVSKMTVLINEDGHYAGSLQYRTIYYVLLLVKDIINFWVEPSDDIASSQSIYAQLAIPLIKHLSSFKNTDETLLFSLVNNTLSNKVKEVDNWFAQTDILPSMILKQSQYLRNLLLNRPSPTGHPCGYTAFNVETPTIIQEFDMLKCREYSSYSNIEYLRNINNFIDIHVSSNMNRILLHQMSNKLYLLFEGVNLWTASGDSVRDSRYDELHLQLLGLVKEVLLCQGIFVIPDSDDQYSIDHKIIAPGILTSILTYIKFLTRGFRRRLSDDISKALTNLSPEILTGSILNLGGVLYSRQEGIRWHRSIGVVSSTVDALLSAPEIAGIRNSIVDGIANTLPMIDMNTDEVQSLLNKISQYQFQTPTEFALNQLVDVGEGIERPLRDVILRALRVYSGWQLRQLFSDLWQFQSDSTRTWPWPEHALKIEEILHEQKARDIAPSTLEVINLD